MIRNSKEKTTLKGKAGELASVKPYKVLTNIVAGATMLATITLTGCDMEPSFKASGFNDADGKDLQPVTETVLEQPQDYSVPGTVTDAPTVMPVVPDPVEHVYGVDKFAEPDPTLEAQLKYYFQNGVINGENLSPYISLYGYTVGEGRADLAINFDGEGEHEYSIWKYIPEDGSFVKLTGYGEVINHSAIMVGDGLYLGVVSDKGVLLGVSPVIDTHTLDNGAGTVEVAQQSVEDLQTIKGR